MNRYLLMLLALNYELVLQSLAVYRRIGVRTSVRVGRYGIDQYAPRIMRKLLIILLVFDVLLAIVFIATGWRLFGLAFLGFASVPLVLLFVLRTAHTPAASKAEEPKFFRGSREKSGASRR